MTASDPNVCDCVYYMYIPSPPCQASMWSAEFHLFGKKSTNAWQTTSVFHSETQTHENIASQFKINKHFRHGAATPTIPLKPIIYCYMSCVYPPIKRCVCVHVHLTTTLHWSVHPYLYTWVFFIGNMTLKWSRKDKEKRGRNTSKKNECIRDVVMIPRWR